MRPAVERLDARQARRRNLPLRAADRRPRRLESLCRDDRRRYGGCTNSASPCKTITYAYAHAAAGSTINVAPGTYTDGTPGYGVYLYKNGAAGAPITLLSTVRGGAIVNEAKCAVSGRSYCNGFYVDSSYNVISGFTITGARTTASPITAAAITPTSGTRSTAMA